MTEHQEIREFSQGFHAIKDDLIRLLKELKMDVEAYYVAISKQNIED